MCCREGTSSGFALLRWQAVGELPGAVYGRGDHLKSSLPSDLCPWKLESLSEHIFPSSDSSWLGPDLILGLWHTGLESSAT